MHSWNRQKLTTTEIEETTEREPDPLTHSSIGTAWDQMSDHLPFLCDLRGY